MTTTTSGAADMPEALRPVEPVALIASIQELNAWEARADGELLTPAEGESIILVLHELKRLLALAAGQATAAQQGAYAALSESFLEIPDVQDESGINAYYSREVVLECIDAALASHGQAPATQHPEGDVVAYLDVGASGYLDLGAALSEDALQQLPKGRHALVIAGAYGIDGYVAAPQPSPMAQAAESVPAPVPPPECETEAEKRAFAFGWFKALESERMKAESVLEDAARRKSHAD